MMHSLLGYGPNTPLAVNGPKGRRANALNWMAHNQPCANRQLLYMKGKNVVGREGTGYQGHPGQFLAMLAQINVSSDYPLHVQGRKLAVRDLIRGEMRACRVDRELTFTLLGLSHFLQSDATWKSDIGETWNLQKILGI